MRRGISDRHQIVLVRAEAFADRFLPRVELIGAGMWMKSPVTRCPATHASPPD